jgi:hypothetical protein
MLRGRRAEYADPKAMTRLSPQVDKEQATNREMLRGRRAEYADPKAMTRLSPQVDKAQATGQREAP